MCEQLHRQEALNLNLVNYGEKPNSWRHEGIFIYSNGNKDYMYAGDDFPSEMEVDVERDSESESESEYSPNKEGEDEKMSESESECEEDKEYEDLLEFIAEFNGVVARYEADFDQPREAKPTAKSGDYMRRCEACFQIIRKRIRDKRNSVREEYQNAFDALVKRAKDLGAEIREKLGMDSSVEYLDPWPWVRY